MGILVVALALLVAAGVGLSNLGSRVDPITPSDLSTTTLRPDGSIRFFGPDAPWNRTAAELGRATDGQEYAKRWFDYATLASWTDPKRRGEVDLQFAQYAVPIYDAATATTTKRVFRANYGYAGNIPLGGEVPWSDEWKVSQGTDRIMIVVDYRSGHWWEYWALEDNKTVCLTPENLAAGFGFDDLCAGTANQITEDDGTPADVRTTQTRFDGRGMGIPKLAMVTRADEVASGRIQHALEMTVYNTMWGPACDPIDDGSAKGAGSTCGFYVEPATKLEWSKGPPSVCGDNGLDASTLNRRRTVPEGMRFALDISDAEIDAWLDSRGYEGALRNTARVFAVALRDYGWVIAETSCFGAAIETDGIANPLTAARWAELGMTDPTQAAQLLQGGLFTEDRVYVVAPGTAPK